MVRYAAFIATAMILAIAVPSGALPQITEGQAQTPQLPGGVNIPGGGRLDLMKPPTPVITSPRAGTRVGNPIRVTGTAKAGTRVDVSATLVVNVPLTDIRTGLGSANTTAAANGRWSVAIGYTLPANVPNAKIRISAVASTPVTNLKSDAATVDVVPARR